jgi:HAD superfamily hydrolase (TIGR01490 family)
VLAGILPRLYPRMLEVAYEHQDAGRPVFIVTAATQGTADMLAHVLFFDGAAGSKLEDRDGVYTGRFDGPFCYAEGKPVRMQQLADEKGIDLSESWAYSDSASDLPMLRAVGHPVAVNPDNELARVAREEGWEVMTFETLGRRLKVAAAFLAFTAVGGASRKVVRRRA